MITLEINFVLVAQGETVRKMSVMQLCKTSRNTITIFTLRADCLELSGTIFY